MANHPHNKDRPLPKGVRKALEKGDMEALALVLSHRQRRFAEEYIIDFNGTAAAIRAGYSPNYADRQSHTLLRHKGVAAYIDHLTRERSESVVSVNPEYVLQKVTDAIAKAETTGNLTALLRACELLAKHLGMLTDRTEISGPDGKAIEIEQRTREDAASFVEQLKSLRKKEDKTELIIK
jgi:phage terminase small subunit